MKLPRNVMGWTYPSLGQEAELTVVRFSSLLVRSYQAGVLGNEIDPLYASGVAGDPDRTGITFTEFNHTFAADARPAAAALLSSCIRAERLLEGDPMARLTVQSEAMARLGGITVDDVRSTLTHFGFRECLADGDMSVPAITLNRDLVDMYPALATPVALHESA